MISTFAATVAAANAQSHGYTLPSYEEQFGKGIRKVVMIQDDIKRTTKIARDGSIVKSFWSLPKPDNSGITRRNRETLTDSIFWTRDGEVELTDVLFYRDSTFSELAKTINGCREGVLQQTSYNLSTSDTTIWLTVDETDKYNLVLVGLPLKEEYGDLIDEEKIVYVGYIDWINHLFKFADLTVLTDDGVSLEEAFTNGKPIVALARIKWGRYQNMAGVFKGAMIESTVEDVCKSIDEAFENYDSMQEKALVYGRQCMAAADDLADDILKKVK